MHGLCLTCVGNLLFDMQCQSMCVCLVDRVSSEKKYRRSMGLVHFEPYIEPRI
jgi:hypothetical protein